MGRVVRAAKVINRPRATDQLEPVLAEGKAGTRDVYFVDTAHFVCRE
jgi:hypothetical protein